MNRRAVSALLALVLAACAQPQVFREGVAIPVEQAADADLRSARIAIQQGDLIAARDTLQRFSEELARSRRADEGWFLLGEVLQRLGERERAASTWRELVVRFPRSGYNPEAAIRAATIYRDLDRPETGRRLLARASLGRADDDLRARVHRMRADLARQLGDYPEAVLALAYARRDVQDAEMLREVDLEIDELVDERLREPQLRALIDRLPRGPVYDRANLVLARRALARGDYDEARDVLDRLPRVLRPADEGLRQTLLARTERGSTAVAETLGAALPLSGPYAAYGREVLRGAVLALGIFDDPNAKFRLLVRDTEGTVEGGTRAVQELLDSDVSAIIGPLSSSVSASAAPFAEDAGVPLLSLAKREDISFLGDFVFRLGLTDLDQIRALARWAVDGRGMRRFAVLYPADTYGRSQKDLFWAEIEALGGEIVGVEKYDPAAVDIQSEVKKLVGLYYVTPLEASRLKKRDELMRFPQQNAEQLAKPEMQRLPPYLDFEALFIPDEARRVGLILPQLRFYDIRDITLLGEKGWNDPVLLKIAGDDARGAVFTDGFFARSERPAVVAFVEEFRGTYGDEPDVFAAEGYDAADLLAGLLQRAGALSREQLRRRILEVENFEGVSGLTSFDATGATHKALQFLTVEDGEIKALVEHP